MKKQLYGYLMAFLLLAAGCATNASTTGPEDTQLKLEFKVMAENKLQTFTGETNFIPGMTIGDLKKELPTLLIRFAPLDYSFELAGEQLNFAIRANGINQNDTAVVQKDTPVTVTAYRKIKFPVRFVRVDADNKEVFSQTITVTTPDIGDNLKDDILYAASEQLPDDYAYDGLDDEAALSLQTEDGRNISSANSITTKGLLVAVYTKPWKPFDQVNIQKIDWSHSPLKIGTALKPNVSKTAQTSAPQEIVQEQSIAPTAEDVAQPTPAVQTRIKILKATYGVGKKRVDVKNALQQEADKTGKLHVPADMNTFIGQFGLKDPAFGKVKTTEIEFEIDGKRWQKTGWKKFIGNKHVLEIKEGEEFRL